MVKLSAWVAETIAPAGMHILCMHRDIISFKITKVSLLSRFFNKTKASVLFLGF